MMKGTAFVCLLGKSLMGLLLLRAIMWSLLMSLSLTFCVACSNISGSVGLLSPCRGSKDREYGDCYWY